MSQSRRPLVKFVVGIMMCALPVAIASAPVSADAATTFSGTRQATTTVPHIASLSTTWVVPPKPNSYVKGVSWAVWNGLQYNINGSSRIIQPVMGWNWFGQPAYTIANWWETADGKYHHGEVVTVKPGTKLTGIMALVKHSGSNWTYKLSFKGYSAADVQFTIPAEANQLYEVIELRGPINAYKPSLVPPNTAYAKMTNIAVAMQSGYARPATLKWSGGSKSTIRPQTASTTVINNSSTKGQVNIHY